MYLTCGVDDIKRGEVNQDKKLSALVDRAWTGCAMLDVCFTSLMQDYGLIDARDDEGFWFKWERVDDGWVLMYKGQIAVKLRQSLVGNSGLYVDLDFTLLSIYLVSLLEEIKRMQGERGGGEERGEEQE